MTSQSSPGYFKLSCDHLTIRRSCVWVVRGDPAQADLEPAVGDDVRNVREILLRFEYDEQMQTVRHTTGGELQMNVNVASCIRRCVAPTSTIEPSGNALIITKQASRSTNTDPLMAAFNAIALMATNPWSAQPSVTLI